MQTLDTIKEIVSNCQFNDWTLYVGFDGRAYVQVLFMDKDRITGKEELQRCRKWYLSYHMTNSEVIRTTFMAVEAAMLHEVQEAFKYKGQRIFNPHMDYEALAEVMQRKEIGVSLREDNNYVPTVSELPR